MVLSPHGFSQVWFFYWFPDRIKNNWIRWILYERCTHICLCLGNSCRSGLWKSQFNFHTPKQSCCVSGVMTQPAGVDMSCRCLMGAKCLNGSHNSENLFFFLTFPESRLSHVSSCRLRNSSSLVPAANCTAASSYLSSKNNCLHFALCLLSSLDTRMSVCTHWSRLYNLIALL